MDEAGYCEAIQNIIRDERMDIDQKLEELERLYQWKPVRTEWFLAKARLLVEKEQEPEVGYEMLEGMCFPGDDSDVASEMLEFLAELDLMRGDAPMAASRRFQIDLLKGNEPEVLSRLLEVSKAEENTLRNGWRGLNELAEAYFSCCKYQNYEILQLYSSINGQDEIPFREYAGNDVRKTWFLREILEKKRKAVILTDVPGHRNEASILGHCLAELCCSVYILDAPVPMEVDALPDMAGTAVVCMDNAEESGGITRIPVIEFIQGEESLGNNSAYILDRICGDEAVFVIASGDRFEDLSETKVLRNRIENMYGYDNMLLTDYMAYGWAGSYLDYISILYGMDVKKAVETESECRFSVVIPARNSARTLEHTLRTCLNQRYKGYFEVIISDNSIEGNTEVQEFCKRIEDRRVRYCKTPRELSLAKSFEYAFLQAKGEYIFSLGADDAMLPWTLEIWDKVIRGYPKEEIFLWDRGFYAWPGFNEGQQHQFAIPGRYRKDAIKCGKLESMPYLALALEEPQNMYLLPTLYINSGFKRSFIGTLLKETGRLWDGSSQDIYMGVVISAIKRNIVKIDYPLAIAGMSSGSAGVVSASAIKNVSAGRTAKSKDRNLTYVYARSRVECLIPKPAKDVSVLYSAVLRAVKRGLLPEHYLEDVFDWRRWFLNCMLAWDIRDYRYDLELRWARCTAKRCGEELLEWFEETVYKMAHTPLLLIEEKKKERTYQEADTEEGRVLDASKYGVKNVYDASLLFEELLEG